MEWTMGCEFCGKQMPYISNKWHVCQKCIRMEKVENKLRKMPKDEYNIRVGNI